jgi:hypothetical protein
MHVAAFSEHEKCGAADVRVVVPKLSRGMMVFSGKKKLFCVFRPQ